MLTREVLDAYLDGIRPQLAQFLDLSDTLLLDNSVWLGGITVIEFLRDVGKHFTVNHMVAKDSVRSRFERPDQGISYTEFSYMLLQAYDFLRLHLDHGCDLQVGGSDQWGNITMGIELIRKVCHEEVWGLTTPLVVKADGTKFGKTGSGTVWLDPARTSPYAMYQYFLNSTDATVGAYLRYFTFLTHAEIEALDDETAHRPERRAAQRALARSVVGLVHGDAEVARAEVAAGALFNGEIAELSEDMLRAVTEDAPTTERPTRRARGRPALGRRPEPRPGWSPPRAKPAAPSMVAASTSTTSVNPTRKAARDPVTSSTTHTSCCARQRDVHVLRFK